MAITCAKLSSSNTIRCADADYRCLSQSEPIALCVQALREEPPAFSLARLGQAEQLEALIHQVGLLACIPTRMNDFAL